MLNKSLELSSNSRSADVVNNTEENKVDNLDIISISNTPYFPPCYEAPSIGKVKEIYAERLDYMVGMASFKKIFKELGIGSSNKKNDIERINSIYRILDIGVLKDIKELSNDDITNIGNFTNRVGSSLYSMIGVDEYVMKHQQLYHVDDMLKDLENRIIHRFIELNYQKYNLIVHLYPHKYMKLKGTSYEDALSYCISVMWATLISLVNMQIINEEPNKDYSIIDLLKEVFYGFNPILTTMIFYSIRPLTPEGYSFMQEFRQVSEANKHLTGKTPLNRVVFRWCPKSNRFEDYLKGFKRIQFENCDDTFSDLRGDNNGKRCCIYDCRIDKNLLITKITIVGQNIMRDITGFATTQTYGLLCDADYLKCLELGILFTILTGTKEHDDLFKRNLIIAKRAIQTGEVKFITEDITGYYGVYTANMTMLAVRLLKKKVFKDLEPNNDYYIATQLVQHFNMRRNVPKDLITVFRMYKLEGEELENALRMVERHKRAGMREKIEYAKTLVRKPRYILHELYNYLYDEGFRL